MLSRRLRLRSGRDFRAVYSRCRTFSTPRLVLAVRHWKSGRPELQKLEGRSVRFGFSISKKTAKRAHDRNLVKRRLREIVRQRIVPRLVDRIDCDMVFNVRPAALTLNFEDLARDVWSLLDDAALIRNDS